VVADAGADDAVQAAPAVVAVSVPHIRVGYREHPHTMALPDDQLKTMQRNAESA